jgi:hypothetical protein
MAKKKPRKPAAIPHKYKQIAGQAAQAGKPHAPGDAGYEIDFHQYQMAEALLDQLRLSDPPTTDDLIELLDDYATVIGATAEYARAHPREDWFEECLLERAAALTNDPTTLENAHGTVLPLFTRPSAALGAHHRLHAFTAKAFARSRTLPPPEAEVLRGSLGLTSVIEGCLIWMQRLVMGLVAESDIPIDALADQLAADQDAPFEKAVTHILITFVAAEARVGLHPEG